VVKLLPTNGRAWKVSSVIADESSLAAVIALHELFWMARTLRPVVLAGYLGALACLLGAAFGELDWAIAGFMGTLPLAFLIKGFGGTRQSTTVSVAATVLGLAGEPLRLAPDRVLEAERLGLQAPLVVIVRPGPLDRVSQQDDQPGVGERRVFRIWLRLVELRPRAMDIVASR
jgi:hypothetical protein